jgi:hypothetical protein
MLGRDTRWPGSWTTPARLKGSRWLAKEGYMSYGWVRDPDGWAEQQFGMAALGDARRTRRAVRLAGGWRGTPRQASLTRQGAGEGPKPGIDFLARRM